MIVGLQMRDLAVQVRGESINRRNLIEHLTNRDLNAELFLYRLAGLKQEKRIGPKLEKSGLQINLPGLYAKQLSENGNQL